MKGRPSLGAKLAVDYGRKSKEIGLGLVRDKRRRPRRRRQHRPPDRLLPRLRADQPVFRLRGTTMTTNRKKVYMTAGYQTISLGTGRKEFNPKKPRPGLEEYIREAGPGRPEADRRRGERRRGRHRQLHGRPVQQAGQPGRPHPGHRREPPLEAVLPGRGRLRLGRPRPHDRRSSPSWPRRPTSSSPSASRSRTRSRPSTARTSWPGRAGTAGERKKGPRLFLPRGVQRPGRGLFRQVRPGEDAPGLRPLVPERRRERPALRHGPGVPQHLPGPRGAGAHASPTRSRSSTT